MFLAVRNGRAAVVGLPNIDELYGPCISLDRRFFLANGAGQALCRGDTVYHLSDHTMKQTAGVIFDVDGTLVDSND